MELQATFDLNFYCEQQRGYIQEPKEWQSVILEIAVDIDRWDYYELSINNQPVELFLKIIGASKRLVTKSFRFSAGHYKLKLFYDKANRYRNFTVVPSKISKDAHVVMLEELIYKLPVDISVSLNRLGAFTGIRFVPTTHSTVAQELLRIQRAILGTNKKMGLVKVLDILTKAPHRILKTQDVWVRSEYVRRPNATKIAYSLVQPNNLSSQSLPVRLMDSRVEHSYNIYENQLLQLYIHQVNTQLRKLKKILLALNNQSLYEQVILLETKMERATKSATFLHEVDVPNHISLKITMVLLNVPAYRAVLDGFQEFRKVMISNINEREMDSPLENTPELYQKWGTLKILAILLDEALKAGYVVKMQRLLTPILGSNTVKVLSDGKPAIILENPITNNIVRFIPERSFTSKGKSLRSISYIQRPDIAIEVSKPNGKTSIFLFDPKYKLQSEDEIFDNALNHNNKGKPQKVDIDKMHAYRDAIRDEKGGQVVEHASILYPGETVEYINGLSAIQAYPSMDKELIEPVEKVINAALEG
ncbi:DUF2357 domain-containing protein [Evansella cellulosilytica]|uniref:DUF2357 domain-containing protein n=1 Tax=Evansella cellulosilytica (strain ATCC 21833 / DSM 2522 / FERM P-1141 / JCM 9156 / N-4) TaxID=649639 RepID=E6TR17_EVAC2|nr:DUF2357 domain-containing protein [Evansella cellulosilytica]ADU29393.1 protein of unknown function DUF524 [Evansella cellulosilytica DSM 2522]